MTELEEQEDRGRRAPDGGWGWVVVVGALVIHLVQTGLAVTFGVFYPVLRDRYQATATQTSLILSIFNLFRMLMGPVASLLAERLGCRPVALAGCVLATMGVAVTAFATNIYVNYVFFGVVAGFGCCISFVPTYITVGRYFDKKKGKAMSLATLGNSLAPLFFAAVFTTLLEKLGYSGAMLILSGFVLHSLPACALYRPLPEPKCIHVLIVTPDPSKEKETISVSTDKDVLNIVKEDEMYCEQENVGHQHRVPKRRWKCAKCIFDCSKQFTHLKNIPFLMYGLTMSSMTISNGCMYAFLPALCIEKGFTSTQIALLFILCGCADCIGRFCGGFVYDLRAFRTRRIWIHGIIGAITGLLTTIIALPMLFIPWVVTLMVCLRAVCIGVFNGQRMTVMADVVGDHKMAACVGLVLWFQGIGSSFGILLAGAIKDWFGSFFAVYLYGGGVLTVFCILYTVQHFVLSLSCDK